MQAKKRSASADYAWKSNLVMGVDLDDPRYAVEENGDEATFRFDGAPYARMRLDGDTLEIDFRKPRDESDLKTVLKHYTKLKSPRGWLRIRTPAKRDPRPRLEAKFGMLFGTTRRELRRAADANKFKSLSSRGPFLVMPASHRVRWWGKEERKKYAALNGAAEGWVQDIADKPALVLGTSDEVTWTKRPGGGVLVRIVAFPGKDISAAASHFSAIPDKGWQPITDAFAVAEPLRCFDASRSGSSVGDRESLELKLPKGKYRIDALRWKPKKGIELLLVRFAKR